MVYNLLTSVVVVLGVLPSVLSVCPIGDIGIGTFFASSFGVSGVIYGNDCSIIDTRDDRNGNFCGSDYINGASVQCNAGTQIPNTAQTGDGIDWGPCVAASQSCGTGEPVLFCCQPA